MSLLVQLSWPQLSQFNYARWILYEDYKAYLHQCMWVKPHSIGLFYK